MFTAFVLAYEVAHLAKEVLTRMPIGGQCRPVVAMPTRGAKTLEAFRGYVDYVVVDNRDDARRAEAAGLRWVLNRYSGKSGALATVLEAIDADAYVFIDDDAIPGPWIEALKRAGCAGFATAYRWVLDPLQNAFSLGGLDWMAWRPTRFLYGGAMAVPAGKRREAVEALLSCPIDDMALTSIADRIEVIPLLVPMRGAENAVEFFFRQAMAAKLGNRLLWAVELVYYSLWTIAALLFPPLFLIHAVRTAVRSRRALGRVDWRQIALSPLERPLQALVFIASAFRRCFWWRGRLLCNNFKTDSTPLSCYRRGGQRGRKGG